MVKQKRVLIITYYWPPAGGAGVQRPLKFSQYLPKYGWQPVIFTAEDPHYPMEDQSLVDQIPEGLEEITCPIWEPYDLYRRFLGYKKEEKVQAGFIEEEQKNNRLVNIAKWVRGNLFIPDARRFWIRPATKKLLAYLEQDPVDVILSTGPPHSVHMIAKAIKNKLGVPWIADFRDPWTNIDFYDQLKLSKWADKKHHDQERSVLGSADEVITVSRQWAKELGEIAGKPVQVITNGFDAADFQFEVKSLDQRFSISHVGTATKDRNPYMLWKVLEKLSKEDSEFKEDLLIRFIGKTDYSLFQSIKEHGLEDQLERVDHLPYTEAIQRAAQSQVLLLLVNDALNSVGRIPLKVFEYLPCRRPVLGIGLKSGDAATIIKETAAGEVFDFQDAVGIEAFVRAAYAAYREGTLQLAERDFSAYSREVQSGMLASILDRSLDN